MALLGSWTIALLALVFLGLRVFFSFSGEAGDNEILIGVVGVTGSGKSSFIQRLTQRKDIAVSDGLRPGTGEVNSYSLDHDGRHFVLVDSPGFDDLDLDDEDVFNLIATWLKTSYQDGQRLNGLIYLHPINSNRQKGSEIRNLQMFKRLCGEENFKNVILGMTFCDQVSLQVIGERMKQLVETPHWWGDMVTRGSCIKQVPLERDGCLQLLLHFVPKEKITLQFQDEVVEQHMSFADTAAAGTVLHHEELAAVREAEAKERAAIQEIFRRQKEEAQAILRKKEEANKREFEALHRRQEREEYAILQERKARSELQQQEQVRLGQDKRDQRRRQLELNDLLTQTQKAHQCFEKARENIVRKTVIRRVETHNLSLSTGWDILQSWKNLGSVKQPYANYHWVGSDRTDDVVIAFAGIFCSRCMSGLGPGTEYYCEDLLVLVRKGTVSDQF